MVGDMMDRYFRTAFRINKREKIRDKGTGWEALLFCLIEV